MDNEKWVWADEEDSSPIGAPLFDAVLKPIAEWPGLEAEPPPPAEPLEQLGGKPEQIPPAAAGTSAEPPAPPAEAQPPNRKIPPRAVRAIVLHLEGRIEDAIQEIKIALLAGESSAELHTAMGALHLEIDRYDAAAATYREVLKIDPQTEIAKEHLAVCVAKANEAKKPSPSLLKAIAFHIEGKVEEAIREL